MTSKSPIRLLDKLILALRARRRAKHRRWLKQNHVLMPLPEPIRDDRDWQRKFQTSLKRK